MNRTAKKRVLYFIPLVLLVSTSLAFYTLSQWMGQMLGYFMSFLFYWTFWCLTVPLYLVGKDEVIDLFNCRKPLLGNQRIRNILFLSMPLLLGYGFEFPTVLPKSNAIIIATSTALAVINASAEEILWRGTYLKILGYESNRVVIFSALGFALWHIAPQLVFGNQQPGGMLSFVAVAFIVGLLYGFVAKDTQSIFLTTISHTLFDFSGLGGRLYF